MKALKKELAALLGEALRAMASARQMPAEGLPAVLVEEASEGHGDLTTNVAMQAARTFKTAPPKLAAELTAVLQKSKRFGELVSEAKIAGPGFLNFYLSHAAYREMLAQILEQGGKFGRSDAGKGVQVMLEFVSANPTGPLTVAHGRQSAVGDVLANILRWAGYPVTKEYLINDRGRQIQMLGRSTFARYKQLLGQDCPLPEDGYQGAYVLDVAKRAMGKIGKKYEHSGEDEALPFFAQFACDDILADIRNDLDRFGVHFDSWFSEKQFSQTGRVKEVLDLLRQKGHVYDQDGAVWFRSTTFGDDKDRVLVKSSGDMTYIAPDIAYHDDKMRRGFQMLVNIWGPDHHGYIPRLKAALTALGYAPDALRVIILQLATLYRDGKQLSMSTRAGEFVTLKEVMDEVGKDAGRYFFVRRKTDAHLDFDLELARKQTPENPVFYVQYAHARISSIFAKAGKLGDSLLISPISMPGSPASANIGEISKLSPNFPFSHPQELALIKLLSRLEEVVEDSAKNLEPHWVPLYLESCAAQFHRFYTECRILGQEPGVMRSRLALCGATQIVLKNGLDILGVSAPTNM